MDDVLREVTFCRKTGIHIIGIIENMSGFVCPSCTVNTFLYIPIFNLPIYSINLMNFISRNVPIYSLLVVV